MSLNWSITKVKNWEEVSLAEKNGVEGYKTEALVFATMTVGLRDITAKNVDEWTYRLGLVERLRGSFLSQYVPDESMPGGMREVPYSFTREDVERRVGLATNADVLPRPRFVKKVTK